ncbi:MAG TPA: erythromycin esterase family protein [Burkholderiaceae bacterium]
MATADSSHRPSPLPVVAEAAQPLRGAPTDYDPLLKAIGNARFVLLGEASHGTQEFYRERARITQRLIVEHGFDAVAVEADWPDAYRVNHYVRGEGGDVTSAQALSGFKRFPVWMWRNTDVAAFVAWLRAHNDSLPSSRRKVGFYGLDLYSLFTSIAEVLHYLDEVDPAAAKRARERYSCFDHFDGNSQTYAHATGLGLSASCENVVVDQLQEFAKRRADYLRSDGPGTAETLFHIEQNARLVVDAEHYYRTMFRGRVSSWNLRDKHMADTLGAVDRHLSSGGKPARIVVWEHNSHVGDARATEIGRMGEWNVGQLAREAYGEDAFLVGFTTYQGSVTAASDWDEPAERKKVRPALAGSYEQLLHQTGFENFLLLLRGAHRLRDALSTPRLERAIGVIYRPETERQSHYFHARLPEQFDAVLHFDTTHAVEPLERGGAWTGSEAPETYPVGV